MITFIPYEVTAQQSVNWNQEGVYGINGNYVNQNMLNSSSVPNLKLAWVYPVPAAPNPYVGHEGVCCTPIIEGGVVYVLTYYHEVIAIDASDGSTLWQTQLPVLNVSAPQFFHHIPPGHYHDQNFFYSDSPAALGRPLIWVISDNYTVFGLDANTGSIIVHFNAVLPRIGQYGNYGFYDTTTPTGFLDAQRGVLVVGLSVSEGTDAGRGFFEGFSLATNPPKLLWMTPTMPPQDGSDPNWDIQVVNNMTGAWIFNGTGAVNLKTLPSSVQHAVLYGDWGTMGFNGTEAFAGVGTGWGGPWEEDYHDGILYVSTSQDSPDDNATFRPGPDLWAASILAINVTTGQYIWGFQSTPHDFWDLDCSWAGALANVTINGQPQLEVVKGCKNGYLYGLNAFTGALNWYFLAPSEKHDNFQIYNPLNSTQMNLKWACYPKTSCVELPNDRFGSLESDIAYNPQTGLAYEGTYNYPFNVTITPVAPTPGVAVGGSGGLVTPIRADQNATLWAVNVATGKPAWSQFLGDIPYRGGLTTTGGLVVAPEVNGTIMFFNAQTGSVVYRQLIGAPMIEQPAVGTDLQGNMLLVQPISVDTAFVVGSPTPGDVLAFSVSPAITTSTVSSAPTGISPYAFYGLAVVAIILAITTITFAIRSGRKPKPS